MKPAHTLFLISAIYCLAFFHCADLFSTIAGREFAPDPSFNDTLPSSLSTYTNPIIPGFHPDPSICRVGGDYFLVNSSFEYFPGIPIFHSRDLVNWRQIGHCLTRKSQLFLNGEPSSSGIGAPTIRHYDGNFYVIATDAGRFGNFYVATRNPAGPWSEPIFVAEYGFDPSLFFDDDGRVYYTSQEGSGEQSHVIMYEIDLRTGRFISDKIFLWQDIGQEWTEGPHLYKINNAYYLVAAAGGTGVAHQVIVAAAAAPQGPFTPCPRNPVLSNQNTSEPVQCAGHADLFQDHNGRWWAVFLGVRRMGNGYSVLGRETFLAPLLWKQGWPLIGENGLVRLTMKGPLPAAAPFDTLPGRDEFDSTGLRPLWCNLRNPGSECVNLSEKPGWLRLRGNMFSLDDVSAPAFVGRRQEHFAMTAATRLDFSPAQTGEEAGLTLRLDESSHYDIAIRRGAAGAEIIVRLRTRSGMTIAHSEPAVGPITLQIKSTAASYTFACSTAVTGWKTIAAADARPLAPESTPNCFTGVVIALYATGNGKPCAAPADFDWFEYLPQK